MSDPIEIDRIPDSDSLESVDSLEPVDNPEPVAAPEPDVGPNTAADLHQVYPVEIEIPVDRLDWMIGNLTLDNAIAALLQFDDEVKIAAMKFLIQRRVDELAYGSDDGLASQPPNPNNHPEVPWQSPNLNPSTSVPSPRAR
jgi:hypothetical protein